MQAKAELNAVYAPSGEVVAREIQGELIIVPITSGVGDLDDEVYTLNDTGRAVWNKLDGQMTLKDVADKLLSEFKAPGKNIERDVLGLATELLKRKILVEVKAV